MRIAMFTNNYKPYIGGVPISIEHLAEALRRQGHTVYVFAPSYEGQQEEPFVIRYPSFPVSIAGAPVPNILTKVFEREVRDLQIDIIHVHHPAIVGNVALRLRRKMGIPVVFTYHTRYEEYLYYIRGLKSLERHIGGVEWYLKQFCRQCDMLFAPTPGMRRYLLERSIIGTPVEVLPTGIPEESFRRDAGAEQEIRNAYGKDVDYLFCSVSRLAKEKNLDFQLEALYCLKQILEKRGKTFRHLILGEGPDRKHLEQEIALRGLEENVLLPGNVENAKIKNYHGAADAFLFTSKSETQGIVILEAMAAGTPVIAVDASGVCDVVVSGENGILTSENALVFAVRTAELMEDEALRRQMEASAVETAVSYSEEKIAERAAAYYASACIAARGHVARQLHGMLYS